MSASCLGLRPPALMTDGWFPRVQAVSSSGECNAFLERPDHVFLHGARWGRLLCACVCLPSLRRGQPNAAAPEARWTLCWAGWLSWGPLRLTRSLAIWRQGWSPNSVDDLLSVENSRLCTIREGGNDDGSMYLDLRGEAEWMTMSYPLWQSSNDKTWCQPELYWCGSLGAADCFI